MGVEKWLQSCLIGLGIGEPDEDIPDDDDPGDNEDPGDDGDPDERIPLVWY